MVCGSPTVSWPVSPLQASSGPCVTGAVMRVRSGSSCLFTQSCSEFSEHQFCARHCSGTGLQWKIKRHRLTCGLSGEDERKQIVDSCGAFTIKRTPEDGPEEVALLLTREESLESAGQHGEESAS